MKVIGLTGGIGSGKSTVARYLAELGAVVLDLDKVGHEIIKAGSPTSKKVVEEFGREVIDAQGEIDRKKLAKVVFKNPKALEGLNRIMHPAIDKFIDKKIKAYRRQGIKVVVLEGAAMLEAGKAGQADEIWVTSAPEVVILKRIRERSGYSKEEARTRINSQMTDAERVNQADVVINTSGSLEEVKARVKVEWRKLMERTGG